MQRNVSQRQNKHANRGPLVQPELREPHPRSEPAGREAQDQQPGEAGVEDQVDITPPRQTPTARVRFGMAQ